MNFNSCCFKLTTLLYNVSRTISTDLQNDFIKNTIVLSHRKKIGVLLILNVMFTILIEIIQYNTYMFLLVGASILTDCAEDQAKIYT